MPLPELPEPNHFTLKQISQRWGCDEDRLIQYCLSRVNYFVRFGDNYDGRLSV